MIFISLCYSNKKKTSDDSLEGTKGRAADTILKVGCSHFRTLVAMRRMHIRGTRVCEDSCGVNWSGRFCINKIPFSAFSLRLQQKDKYISKVSSLSLSTHRRESGRCLDARTQTTFYPLQQSGPAKRKYHTLFLLHTLSKNKTQFTASARAREREIHKNNTVASVVFRRGGYIFKSLHTGGAWKLWNSTRRQFRSQGIRHTSLNNAKIHLAAEYSCSFSLDSSPQLVFPSP